MVFPSVVQSGSNLEVFLFATVVSQYFANGALVFFLLHCWEP